MMNSFKKIISLEEAMAYFHDNMTLMFGGFGGVGSPPTLIQGILQKNTKNLHLIGNDTGFPQIGVGQLVTNGQVASLITSHIGSNPNAGKGMSEGSIQIEFCPQGTLAERIRAGGMGLGGILTDIGLDTMVETGKQRVIIENKTYLIEKALTAEVAIVYAKKVDEYGNMIFDKSARNMNPMIAMAGEITIVEAEEIVPLGELNPEEIIVPGVYVNYIVQSEGVDWTWVWE